MNFARQDLFDMMNKESDTLKLAETSGWTDEGKYAYQDYVFEFEDKFYEISLGRSGSYFTHYDYDSEYWDDEVACQEVFKTEKTITVWASVPVDN